MLVDVTEVIQKTAFFLSIHDALPLCVFEGVKKNFDAHARDKQSLVLNASYKLSMRIPLTCRNPPLSQITGSNMP